MKSKQPMLQASLGPDTAAAFAGGSAGANVGIIVSLPPDQKVIARAAFSDSLSTMWIMYVACAALGLCVSFFITKNVLNKKHEETKTGLDEEKKRRDQREQERKDKKDRKRVSQAGLSNANKEAGSGEGVIE